MNTKIIFIVIVLALLFSATTWYFVRPSNDISTFATTQRARPTLPDVNLRNVAGETVSLADFRGRPLVITVWTTWCPFCSETLRDLALLQQELGDRIVIAAINRSESYALSRHFTDTLGITDGLLFLRDPKDELYAKIGGFSMPETIFTDENGLIVAHTRGRINREDIRARMFRFIEEL